jgi:hypothetical protein
MHRVATCAPQSQQANHSAKPLRRASLDAVANASKGGLPRVIALECVPWLLLFASLLLIDRFAPALPRLGVPVSRPLWDVLSRWLERVLVLGVVLGATWSSMLEWIRCRAEGEQPAPLVRRVSRLVAAGGMALCLVVGGYLAESGGARGSAALALFVLPLFSSWTYVLRRLARLARGASIALWSVGSGSVALCVVLGSDALVSMTLIAVPFALLLLLEERISAFTSS